MAHPPTEKGSTSTTTTKPDADFLLEAYTRLREAVNITTTPILPSPSTLTTCLNSLPSPTSASYLLPLGAPATHTHLLSTILPALNHQSLSPRYLGFVTGGALPIAEAADNLVSALDQNVQVHFPAPPPPSSPQAQAQTWTHSACTAVEDAALRMLISLLDLDTGGGSTTGDTQWTGRTFTTGATASNMLGLACGREAVINARRTAATGKAETVAEVGLLAACQAAGVKEIQVLTSMGHSSLFKAASVVGLGRASVRDVGVAGEPWKLDLDRVETELRRAEEGVVSIVVVSAGEVNTGRFATNVLDMPKLRSLADRYGAWVHVDGGEYLFCLPPPFSRLTMLILKRVSAFGLFARALPKTDEFLGLHANVAGLELADSIAADGHKLLNVVCHSQCVEFYSALTTLALR
jgi:glutamate/tyrosine decarboxylase-like PLP-dependent enzyme